jgi:hypothetical protein
MYRRVVLTLILLSLPPSPLAREHQPVEVNTVLMQSTFKIQGPARTPPNSISTGTVFFLGRPSKSHPNRSNYVLVTAAHVLEDIAGDDARIILRNKNPEGIYTRFPFAFKIRDHGTNLYVRHPSADVAAMYFDMPIKDPFLLVDDSVLADDSALRLYEIHPGDELFCLGYPLGAEANDAGFPILRGGKIASYPIVPTSKVRSILFDLSVFAGNSGGPVYFSYETRNIAGRLTFSKEGNYIAGVVGLITQLAYVPQPVNNGTRTPTVANVPIQVGIIVPSVFIKETVAMLPEK